MSNHIICEVFDYEIYDMNGDLLFEVHTAKSNSIEYRESGNELTIEDAIVSTSIFKNFMYGKYSNKFVKVLGKTKVRTIDGRDNAMLYMTIGVATIDKYSISGIVGDSFGSTIVIRFPSTNRDLNSNIDLDLQIIDDVRDDKKDSGDYIFFE